MMGVFVQLNEGTTRAKVFPVGYVIQESGCWDWVGGRDPDGYGVYKQGKQFVGRRSMRAHRWVYEQTKGFIPEGLQLDHLCRNRLCVNPAHLEPVTQQENIRRGLYGVTRTHCPKGHEYTPENTYRHQGIGTKTCRECARTRDRIRRSLRIKIRRVK